MAIGGYFIINYWCLLIFILVAIGGYYIYGY
jgi:hypothetical protein